MRITNEDKFWMLKPGGSAVLAAPVLLFLFFVMTAAVPAVSGQSGRTKTSAALSDEARRRQAVVNEAMLVLEEAKKLAAASQFEDARRKCEAASKMLETMESSQPAAGADSGVSLQDAKDKVSGFMSDLRKKWAQKIEDDAMKAFRGGKYDAASAMAKQAAEINPERAADIEAFVERCNKSAAGEKFKNQTSLSTIDPDNKIRKEDIHLLLREAEILYKNQRYDQAKSNLEKVLIRDPYNDKAVELFDRIHKRLYDVAKVRRGVEFLERIGEVEWKWNEGVLPTEAIKPKPQGPVAKGASNAGLFEKLQKIIFDNIEFEDASIAAVVMYLNQRSKQLDPDKTGVNILLQPASPGEMDTIPRITMSFDQIPMSEVLRYLCQLSNMKFRVEEKAVIIGRSNIDNMETRFFPVRSAMINSIPGISSTKTGEDFMAAENTSLFDSKKGSLSKGEGSKGGGAAATASTQVPSSAVSDALKKYFSVRGIPFDAGATIDYDRYNSRLIVKNTPENLRKLDYLLRDLDIQTPLVLIEAKFLEISQNDVDELGFDWTVKANPSSGDYWTSQPNEKILRSYDATNNNYNSYTGSSDKLINNLTLFPNIGGTSYDVNLTVNAISQSGRGEILSAPKVIATSGTNAIIRMVREEYFPTSWNEPQVSVGSSGSYTYTPTYPELGEATDVGIRFEVTPTVSSNNYTVTLHMRPQVISLTGWTEYYYDLTIGNIAQKKIAIKMPELSRRDVDTNVKVFDGESVVLGGMLRDKNWTRDDKWPFFGDIPLAGRLFRSQLDKTDKINLMIFVTARLMNSDGVPVRPSAQRGVPEFNR